MGGRSPVAKEGWPFILGFALVSVLASALLPTWGCWVPFWVLTLWCIWFFRDPERTVPQEAGILLVAPADGRVVAVEEVPQAPLGMGPARKISIFMNVFSVHVNRVPMTGVVKELQYHRGRFLNAALDKASVDNERMEIMLEEGDTRIVFVQVAGLVARRIVCRLQKGERVERGSRFGLIRFGSRVDVYLPLSARIVPTLGETTRAGETILARLQEG
ncbi:MAG: phosphatidylserine decarboxylase family protein [Magnetococcales bacterium]|nr:phosphatidylserine decarboxylase family protein [Magnetococcales bacterium]